MATNRVIRRTVAAPTSVAAGAATDTSDCQGAGLALYLLSAGTATYQAQASPDDGTSWVNVGTALTASGTVAISIACTRVRWNCTAYTNGTPTSYVCGAPV